ncbi:MAG: hypothetical protein ABIA37_00665 [Candidatus Woesearchaeota archaeon]
MVVFKEVKRADLGFLTKANFEEGELKSIYEELRLSKEVNKKKIVLILYTSGKLLLQGNEEEKEKVAAQLRKKGLEEIKPVNFRVEKGVIIGSDESLKGDTFGGLVVAAVKADDVVREKLKELGVADSKKLADKEIIVMADKIRNLAECEVISIFPEEYNRNKITRLLNKLHRDGYNYLKPGKHVVDKYPGCTVGEIKEEKAEDKYVEVAAASVLARAAALKQLDSLSMKAGFDLPKGSTHVKLALHELKKKGLDFREFVKLDFKNVVEFLSTN